MERKFGVVLTTGYLTFTLDTGEVSTGGEALDTAYDFVMSGESEVYGVFNMPGCPSHAYAAMRLNPAHVVGVIELPERK